MDWVTAAQEYLFSFVRAVRMVLEGIGALWVVVGLIVAMAESILGHMAEFSRFYPGRRRPARFTQIRLTFSHYLSSALEFQLASDILSTSISPGWRELGELAAT
jgi:uncharacterized membrane protein